MTSGPAAQQAISDLATRLNISPDAIRVISAEHVVWRDGSLGCPRPGMIYTQALVPGLRIVLDAEGTLYYYHAGRGRPPFYCPHPSGEPVESDT